MDVQPKVRLIDVRLIDQGPAGSTPYQPRTSQNYALSMTSWENDLSMASLLETFWQILLYWPDDSIAIDVQFSQIERNYRKFRHILLKPSLYINKIVHKKIQNLFV